MSATTVQEARAPYGLKIRAPAEERVILHDIRWSTYEALVNDLGDNRGCRLAYDQGTLEIMMPYYEHDGFAAFFDLLINVLACEFDLRYMSARSMTCKREDIKKGIEPDACFYIQSFGRIRGKRKLDFFVDPPPDLMIEVDISTNSMNKLPICMALGVPEHWRFDGNVLEIRILKDGKYELSDESLALPGLIFRNEMPRFFEIGFDDGLPAMQDAFRKWIREHTKK